MIRRTLLCSVFLSAFGIGGTSLVIARADGIMSSTDVMMFDYTTVFPKAPEIEPVGSVAPADLAEIGRSLVENFYFPPGRNPPNVVVHVQNSDHPHRCGLDPLPLLRREHIAPDGGRVLHEGRRTSQAVKAAHRQGRTS